MKQSDENSIEQLKAIAVQLKDLTENLNGITEQLNSSTNRVDPLGTNPYSVKIETGAGIHIGDKSGLVLYFKKEDSKALQLGYVWVRFLTPNSGESKPIPDNYTRGAALKEYQGGELYGLFVEHDYTDWKEGAYGCVAVLSDNSGDPIKDGVIYGCNIFQPS